MNPPIDLGSGYTLTYTSWKPDRRLNPQYDGVPDVERYGAIIRCPHGVAALTFASEVQAKIEPSRKNVWTVVSYEPLTLSPSIHNTECGCHGFVRDGKWVRA